MDEVEERRAVRACGVPVDDADEPSAVDQDVASEEIAVAEPMRKVGYSDPNTLADSAQRGGALPLHERSGDLGVMGWTVSFGHRASARVERNQEVEGRADEAEVELPARSRPGKLLLQRPVRKAYATPADRPRDQRFVEAAGCRASKLLQGICLSQQLEARRSYGCPEYCIGCHVHEDSGAHPRHALADPASMRLASLGLDRV